MSGRGIIARILEQGRKLNALHNTTAEGVRAADRIGGIPAPSHAVIPEGQAFDGFGDISLIAGRDMVDPEMGHPLFNADVYSRRQPRPIYRVKSKDVDAIYNELKPFYEAAEDSGIWELSDNIRKGDPSRLSGHTYGARLAYAKSKGVDVDIPKVPVNLRDEILGTERMRQYFAENGYRVPRMDDADEFARYSQTYRAAAEDYIQQVIASETNPSSRKNLEDTLREVYITDRINSENGNLWPGKMNQHYRDAETLRDAPMEVDRQKLSDILDEVAPREDSERWFTDRVMQAYSDPYFERGRSKVPYTAENLADFMNARTRGEEQTIVEGLGKQRSRSARQFKNIEQARAASDSIVPADEFNQFKELTNEKLFALVDRLESKYSSQWSKIDDVSRAVGDVMKGMSPQAALRKNDLTGNADDEILELANMVKNGPAEYFESKFGGVAQLGDYLGAVVPENTPQDVIDSLKARGLQVETYTDPASRAAARGRIPGSSFVVPLGAAGIGTAALLGSGEAEAGTGSAIRRVGDVFGDVPELADVADIPIRITNNREGAIYDRFKKEIRVPEWALGNQRLLAEEAFHALQDKRGLLTQDRMADNFGELNVTPELKSAYEDFAEHMVRTGVDIDRIPSLDTFEYEDDVLTLLDDMARELGKAPGYGGQDFDVVQSEGLWERLRVELEKNYRHPDEVLHDSPVEREAYEFSKRFAGSADPKLLAGVGAAGAAGVAAQRSDTAAAQDTLAASGEEIRAASERFQNRRSQKRGIWDSLKEEVQAAGFLGTMIPATIASGVSRIAGYPLARIGATSAETVNQFADSVGNTYYTPDDRNRYIEELGRGLERWGELFGGAGVTEEAFQQSVPVRAFNAMPPEEQMLIRGALDLL